MGWGDYEWSKMIVGRVGGDEFGIPQHRGMALFVLEVGISPGCTSTPSCEEDVQEPAISKALPQHKDRNWEKVRITRDVGKMTRSASNKTECEISHTRRV